MVLLLPGPLDLERVAAFTLRTALAWLGHACAGDCPPAAASIPAQTWVVRTLDGRPHGRAATSSESETSVLVHFGLAAHESVSITQLLEDVNRCTASDHIRVFDSTEP